MMTFCIINHTVTQLSTLYSPLSALLRFFFQCFNPVFLFAGLL